MEHQLRQYFDHGGRIAVIVRITGGQQRRVITLPCPEGRLLLEARNPGPFEYLRASVDYDNLPDDGEHSFNLTVHRLRSPAQPYVEEQEIYHAMSTDPSQQEYLGQALSNSGLIRLAGAVPEQRPLASRGPGAGEEIAYIYCDDERHEYVPISDYDLIGSERDATGLFALNQVPVIDFLMMLTGEEDRDPGPVALFAAERYCMARNALLIVDPPLAWNSIQAVIKDRHGRFGSTLCSPNVLTYFPRIKRSPAKGRATAVSAAGAIAGLLASHDAGGSGDNRIHDGRLALRGRHSLIQDLDEFEAGQLARFGINCLRGAGSGRVELSGLVTLAQSKAQAIEWNCLARRRSALFIINSIIRSTRWAAFEKNTPAAWQELRLQIEPFLAAQHRKGLLRGMTPADAFYVKCDLDTNSGRCGQPDGLAFVVGLALTRPGDYLAFRFRHDRPGCSVTELGWQPGMALTG